MTDYIKSSQVIQEFLDKEKIKIEVAKNAPCVYKLAEAGPLSGVLKVGFYGMVTVRGESLEFKTEYVCPYYGGDGGADNSLKALRALEEKWGGGKVDERF